MLRLRRIYAVLNGVYERPVKSISELLDTCHIVTKIYRLKEIKEMKIKWTKLESGKNDTGASLSEKLGCFDTWGMNNLPITEAAVMSWLDLNTPILPHRKFLSVYNSKISGFTELSTTKACVVGKITVTLFKYV